MNDIAPLEHVLFFSRAGSLERVARSPGFLDEWLLDAERLCVAFGARPEGVTCPAAVFAQPLGRGHVAVVQVADQGNPIELAFHVIVLPAKTYGQLGGDPFHVAEHCPPPWTGRGELTPLACPPPLPVQRSAAAICKVIQTPESAALLGGAQVLLDGGRVVFQRPAPDLALVRGLWLLLPDAARLEFWPASFAFSNTLRFHVLVVPQIDPAAVPYYLNEDAAADYPEGKYERALQTAAEQGDQATLDALFSRRSYRQIRNLAIVLLIVGLFIPMIFRLLEPSDPGVAALELPGAAAFAPWDGPTRSEATAELEELARDLDAAGQVRPMDVAAIVAAPAGQWGMSAVLEAGCYPAAITAEYWIHALDVKLGTPDVKHRPARELWYAGPAERQLRCLLWKHALEEYKDLDLKPRQLVDLLRGKFVRRKS